MTKEMLQRNVRWRVLIPFLLALAYVAPSALFKCLWLDLQSVRVTDAESAYTAHVDVNRKIKMGGYIGYTVAFRRAKDDLQVCVTPRQASPYKAGLAAPIRGETLGWWAGGLGSKGFANCVLDGLDNGKFYAVTCHTRLLGQWLPFGTRCTPSNVFQLGRAS